MYLSQVGDASRLFVGSRQNNSLKTELHRLTDAMAMGLKQDLPTALGADRNRLKGIETKLSRSEQYTQNANARLGQLEAQQLVLESVDDIHGQVAQQLVSLSPAPRDADLEIVVNAAEQGIKDVVSGLNSTYAGRSLFAGIEGGSSALMNADDLMADLAANIDVTQPIADIMTDLDSYFDDPSGRFHTIAYTGGSEIGTSAAIDDGKVSNPLTNALDPALRGVLKALAAVALSSGANSSTQRELLLEGRNATSESMPMASLRGRVGLDEARIEETVATHQARTTALTLQYNDLTSADPYETASRLQEIQLQLETHYTLVSRQSRLKLLNFL